MKVLAPPVHIGFHGILQGSHPGASFASDRSPPHQELVEGSHKAQLILENSHQAKDVLYGSVVYACIT